MSAVHPRPDHYKPDPPVSARPATPIGSSIPVSPAPCVHVWAHAGVRWWIDDSTPPVSWVLYFDQYHCRHCLAVESRPINYRHRLGDLSVKDGTFAVDSELAARLLEQALAYLKPTSAYTTPSPGVSPAPEAS